MDSFSEDRRKYLTDISQLTTEDFESFILSGVTASDLLLGKSIDSRTHTIVYSHTLDHDLPDGDHQLIIFSSDELPGSFPYNGYRIAAFDTLVYDHRKEDARDFQVRLETEAAFRDLLRRHLSSEKKQELYDHFTDTPYQYDDVRHTIEDIFYS